VLAVFFLLPFVVLCQRGPDPINCGNADGLNITVTFTNKSATVISTAPGNSFTLTYENLVDVWDGHLTGLITGKGFSLTYQNNFGCYTNIQTTVFTRVSSPLFSVLQFPKCGGAAWCRR